jgi:uncharacterized protein (TIRG00374 family)
MLKFRRRHSWQSYELGRDEIDSLPSPTSSSEEISKPGKSSTWKRWLPGVVVSVVCILAILLIVDREQFIKAFRLADYRWIILGMSFSILWLFFRSLVWRTLLREQASFSQTFFTLSEGYLVNYVLPFRLGEIARGLLMSQKANIPFFEVFATIIIERLLDLALAVSLLFATLLFVIQASWSGQAIIGLVLLVTIGLVFLYLIALNQNKVRDWVNRLTQHWPKFQKIIETQLSAFLTGLSAITDYRRFLRVIFWFLINWFIAILQYLIFLKAFFPHANFLMAAFTLAVTSLGIAAPSSPGSIGVLELSIVGALSVFDLDTSFTLALALIIHLSGYLVIGVLGVIGLAREGQTLTGIYQRIRTFSLSLKSG